MKLDIKEIRQDKGSVDCNLVCTQMVLEYFGVKKSLDEIKKKIKMIKMGTYLPQSGKYFEDLGFKTRMITQSPFLFTNKDRNMLKQDIYDRILARKEDFNRTNKYNALRHFKTYLDAGGEVIVKIPNISDIEKELKAGNPIICSYTNNFLAGDTPRFNLHAAVIYGVDDKYVYVKDPFADERGGDQKYLHEDFLYSLWGSLYADPDNGSLLVIEKR